MEEFQSLKTKPERVQQARLQQITGYRFYNLSKMHLSLPGKHVHSLLDDPNNLAPNLNSFINGFSPNVRAIMEKVKFSEQVAHMAEKNILFDVIKAFAQVDLSPQRVDQIQMGYVFEELIRIGAEQSEEEAGEHFTPREVIKLMVNLLLAPEQDIAKSDVVKTIYDPACGTGGMLFVAEEYIRQLNAAFRPHFYGQDWNDEAWAVCKSDMLIKGEDADNIIHDSGSYQTAPGKMLPKSMLCHL
jgi:type I restriction enzyme M protein